MRSTRVTKTAAVVGAALLLGTALVVAGNLHAHDPASRAAASHTRTNMRSREAIQLRQKMRKRWEDHIVWTRQVIVSVLADLPDAESATGRLLRNQDHIGNLIKPYYGEAAGDQLSALLRDHIVIAADLLHAAKSGDSEGVDEAMNRWNANADDVAAFLDAANPRNWPRSEMRSMMADHLEWTLAEATARLDEDWDADVAAYNRVHRDILQMADMLSRGIIAQFPRKF